MGVLGKIVRLVAARSGVALVAVVVTATAFLVYQNGQAPAHVPDALSATNQSFSYPGHIQLDNLAVNPLVDDDYRRPNRATDQWGFDSVTSLIVVSEAAPRDPLVDVTQ